MEQHLKEILELSLDIHYYYEVPTARYVYVNQSISDHFGIAPNEIVGKDYTGLAEIIHPEDRETFETHWGSIEYNQTLNTKYNTTDYRCRTVAGKFLWFNDSHRYIRNNNGNITAIIGCIRDITDTKVVEILKSTTKERLTMAMEAASDSIWEWKVTSNKLFLDSRFYNILGFEPYEFPDNFLEWEARMHPDDRKMAFSLLKQCSTGVSNQIHIEYRIKTKDNKWKWLLCRAKVSGKNDAGKITRIIGTQTDITKLKEAEAEIRKQNMALLEAEKIIQKNSEALQTLYNNLKENEERLKLFFDESKNTAFLMLETVKNMLCVTEFSSGGENIFGISKSDVMQKNIEQVFKTQNKHFSDLIKSLDQTNEDYKGEINLYKEEDQFITCLLTIHFIANESSRKKILIILTDINERKEFELALKCKNEELLSAEEELKATNEELKFLNEEIQHRNVDLRKINDKLLDSEEKFRELAENTNDAFLLRDKHNILYINPSFEKVWGRSRREIFETQHHFEKWVHPQDRGRFTKWDDFNAFSKIKSYSEQYRIIKSDGSVRWLWSRIHPVFNSTGEIYRLAVIATDITEQKDTEEALVRAKEKAMESDRLKSAFLANISHEIRTPMNGILGFIDLLNDTSLTKETRDQYVQIISKSSKQLLQIINDIIDISKIEANQLNIDIAECNINSTIKDVFLFYQNNKIHLERKSVELKMDLPLPNENAKIYTDESRVRQILMNLIDNALKFTNEGEIVAGYKVANKTIRFYVKDTGIGIPKEQHQLVFERFRQVDDSATRKFGGTGLGLSICEGLVRLLGGAISFESEVDKGSTFYVEIPYNPVKQREPYPDTIVNLESPNWEGITILVVEDDYINFEYLNTVIEPSNATVIHAVSGEDAIRIFNSNKAIDLVLMDIRLPGINGYQAMKSIKEQNPQMPVIAQTAFAMAEDSQNCLEQGFDDYISKPINRQLLMKMINAHLPKKYSV